MAIAGRSHSGLGETHRRALSVLRDHPWATASQAGALMGASQRSAQRYLSGLVSDGLAQTAQAPLVRGSLYAPSSDGIAALAGSRQKARTYAHAFHVDGLSLAQTLLRTHPLLWARDFLALLAARGELQWAVSPWKARPGRKQTLRLDGYGCALWMGRYVLFAIVADPGGLAVEGYAPLFKSFSRWAGGDDFDVMGVRPALVLLTTYARRAQQLAVLWRDVAGRESGASLDLFVAVFDDLARNPAGWWRGGSAQQGPLWSGCRGSATALTRPWPSLSPVAASRFARVRDLVAWLQESERGLRRAVRAFLALSGKEWGVLEQVARWPLLRGADLASLGEYGENGVGVIAAALRELEGSDLVDVVRDGDAARRSLELQQAQLRGRLAQAELDAAVGQERPDRRSAVEERLARIGDDLQILLDQGEGGEKRYVLSPLGLELLAAARGLPPLAYGRARLWPVGYENRDGRRVAALRTGRYLLAYEHTVLVDEFFLGLRRLAVEQWRDLNRNHELLIWDSVECARYFWDGHGRQVLLPDAGGVYRIGGETYEFWLEMDRGRSVGGKHGKGLRRKYERYYLYRRRPDAIYGGDLPRLLIVTPQLGRARQVRRVILDLAQERREPPLPVYFATLVDLWREPEKLSDGSLAPRPLYEDGNGRRGRPARKVMWPGLRVWYRVDDFGAPTWCFEGLGRMPPGTQRGLDLKTPSGKTRAGARRSAARM
jgi:hypothetical protein